MSRKIFRNLVEKEEARQSFYAHAPLDPISPEQVILEQALGRITTTDIYAPIDVPPFDRASMDGFAVRSADTSGAEEDNPLTLEVIGELKAGYVFDNLVEKGCSVEISTGAPLPAGADSVVMVEYNERKGEKVIIYKPTTPGENVMAAGADMQVGERVLSASTRLTSRELGVLAALGIGEISVYGRPKVGIFSSGDEIIRSSEELKPGKLYDINSTAIAAVCREHGAEPEILGILKDREEELSTNLASATESHDVVIISGGTSAGMGDILYQVIDNLGEPGLLVHGVKIKPGKPTILGVCNGTPVIGLPGYPASALSIFQFFVIPYLRIRSGLPPLSGQSTISASIKQRLRSVRGRHEFKPVYLLRASGPEDYIAFPVPGGSGAITSVALADGIIEIPEDTGFLASGDTVQVNLISDNIRLPDIQLIGSHDIALAQILGAFERKYPQYKTRAISAGSRGGVSAIRRGEAHIAGVHLLDPQKGYNVWLKEEVDAEIISGYMRMQGLMVAPGNPKEIYGIKDLFRDDVRLINRNPGSGTRILLDAFLEKMEKGGNEIEGYNNSARSHTSAAEVVRQGIADVAIGIKAASTGLDFIPLREEEYDLLVSKAYTGLEAVQDFILFFKSEEAIKIINSIDGYSSKS